MTAQPTPRPFFEALERVPRYLMRWHHHGSPPLTGLGLALFIGLWLSGLRWTAFLIGLAAFLLHRLFLLLLSSPTFAYRVRSWADAVPVLLFLALIGAETGLVLWGLSGARSRWGGPLRPALVGGALFAGGVALVLSALRALHRGPMPFLEPMSDAEHPVYQAILARDEKAVRKFFAESRATPEMVREQMTRWLQRCLDSEDPEHYRMLARLGADLDAGPDPPLVRAARHPGGLGRIRALLDAGASVHAREEGGITALMWAATRHDLELIELLLARGADAAAVDDRGRSAAVKALGDEATLAALRAGDRKAS